MLYSFPMKVLTVDIGTGTQDIYLYDSQKDLENGYKLVLPSPTMLVNWRLKEATRRRRPVLLSGEIMGGGPSQWAAEAHLREGLSVYATPDAARSFNDDLSVVADMGICIVSEDEALCLSADIEQLKFRDFNFPAIQQALSLFDISLDDLAAISVAVFDHGNAPPGISDRQFRFDYLDQRIQAHNRLSAFAYLAEDIPAIMTRMQAVAHSSRDLNAPLVVMDTAPAAVLGATFDPLLVNHQPMMVANIGNFHTLAFRLGESGIDGVFEHHTGLLNQASLEKQLIAFAAGTLKNTEVFEQHGHGALIYNPDPMILGSGGIDLVVTGPRRSLLRGSSLQIYYPAPFGDMMLTGCFGLLSAVADLLPELTESIRASLYSVGNCGTAPWEVSP